MNNLILLQGAPRSRPKLEEQNEPILRLNPPRCPMWQQSIDHSRRAALATLEYSLVSKHHHIQEEWRARDSQGVASLPKGWRLQTGPAERFIHHNDTCLLLDFCIWSY